MTLGRKGSFFAFVGLQTSMFPLSRSQDGFRVAGLTLNKEYYIPVSLLLPTAGSGTTKLNQQPKLTTTLASDCLRPYGPSLQPTVNFFTQLCLQ